MSAHVQLRVVGGELSFVVILVLDGFYEGDICILFDIIARESVGCLFNPFIVLSVKTSFGRGKYESIVLGLTKILEYVVRLHTTFECFYGS